MPTFDPDLLASTTSGHWSLRPAGAITGFSVDGRRISPGEMFVALKTESRDGHDYLDQALRAGASAALVRKERSSVAIPQLVVKDPLAALQAIASAHRRTFKGTVFGITGSAGKTSTKELLALLLGGAASGVLATEGNLNNQIGVALTLCRLAPDRHRYAVIEAGISAPGEMNRLAAMIEPDTAIVTLVAPAHLADLGSIESVAREKSILAAAVHGGSAIFPSSCETFAAFRGLPRPGCLVVIPVTKTADLKPSLGRVPFTVGHEADRTTLTLGSTTPPSAFNLRRVTDGMAQNAVIAVTAALEAGIAPAEIQKRLDSWGAAPLRGEWRTLQGQRLYLDCYNANPASMADSLEAFASLAPADEPRLLVIGSMEELGADSEQYHLELGRSLRLRKNDLLFAIGDMGEAVRDGALAVGADRAQIEVSATPEPLAARLAAFRGSIFVKGSRRYQLEKAFAGPELAGSPHA